MKTVKHTYGARSPSKSRLISQASTQNIPKLFMERNLKIKPSAIIFKDSTTLSVGVSGHSAAGDTVTGTFISALAVDSTPGPATSTAMLDESSKPPALSAPKPL